MRSPIIKITMLLFGIILSVSAKAQIVTTNPLEYVALAEGNELILGKVKDQMDGQKKTALLQNTIVAAMSMNNLYIETATELVTVFSLLRDAVAKGDKENMLTGAERSQTLWALNDQLSAFQKKLNLLYLSIRTYTMTDVWNSVTAGMLDRNNGEVARMAMNRWRRAATIR